jgi:hypothetical protein
VIKRGSQGKLGNFEWIFEVAGSDLVYEWKANGQNRRCLRVFLTLKFFFYYYNF